MRMNAGILIAVAVIVVGAVYYVWTQSQTDGLPADIAFGNGQIEAVQVDVASLIA